MVFARFLAWWRRRPSRPEVRVVVYSRQGCHLCDEAWELLERSRAEHGFRLEKVDVDTDPGLKALYGEWVPVVTVNGKIRFRGRVNLVLLRRLFRRSSPP
jgi:glutaredoxin